MANTFRLSLLLTLALFFSCYTNQLNAKDPHQFRISVTGDFGEDIGQNFGTLFELTDQQGKAILGAGFQGCYNTEARSDRLTLHFYFKPESFSEKPAWETLPRSTTNSGVYLDDFQGALYAKSKSVGIDDALKKWNATQNKWELAKEMPYRTQVGEGALTVTETKITYNDETLLDLSANQGLIQSYYYANGFLVFRIRNPNVDPVTNDLYACAWKPGNPSFNLDEGIKINLRWEKEFVYACGQLENDILITTNTGGVYCLKNQKWKVLLEPDRNVSFQIYAIVNYYDRILMGQYPTGELYSYDGSKLELIKGWPPVMKGVSDRAREAQSLAIYNGDLYVGVWPWAEVWKYEKSKDEWNFVRRMFTHPELTNKTVHPYEAEANDLKMVMNIWGQRVTSLFPVDHSLYVSTSAKSAFPWKNRYTFLDKQKWEEYGSIYRMTLPGNLSVKTDWKKGKTNFQFEVTQNQISIKQDGKLLGEVKIPAWNEQLVKDLQSDKIKVTTENGVYGKFRGHLSEFRLEAANQ